MIFERTFSDGSKIWCTTDLCWGYMGNNFSIAKNEFWKGVKQKDYLKKKYIEENNYNYMISGC